MGVVVMLANSENKDRKVKREIGDSMIVRREIIGIKTMNSDKFNLIQRKKKSDKMHKKNQIHTKTAVKTVQADQCLRKSQECVKIENLQPNMCEKREPRIDENDLGDIKIQQIIMGSNKSFEPNFRYKFHLTYL